MALADIFSPQTGSGTVSLAMTSASTSAVAMGNFAGQAVRVYNASVTAAFVTFGSSTVTAATTTSMPIGAGLSLILRPPAASLYAAGILSTAAATGTLYFTPGAGN